TETVRDLDLAEQFDRWYALNEVLDMGNVRAAFYAKPGGKTVASLSATGVGSLREELQVILAPYGVRPTFVRKQDGDMQLFAERFSPKVKIYLCLLSRVQRGEITPEMIVEKVEKKGLSPRKEGN